MCRIALVMFMVMLMQWATLVTAEMCCDPTMDCKGVYPECENGESDFFFTQICGNGDEWKSYDEAILSEYPPNASEVVCTPELCELAFGDLEPEDMIAQSSALCNCSFVSRSQIVYTGDNYTCEYVRAGAVFERYNPTWKYIPGVYSNPGARRLMGTKRRAPSLGDYDYDTPRTTPCYVSAYQFEHSVLVQTSLSPSASWQMVMRKYDWSESFTCTGASCTVSSQLPNKIWTKSGELYIDIFTGADICGSTAVYIIGESWCKSVDCIVCVDTFKFYDCLSVSHKVFFILIMILIFGLILVLAPWLLEKVVQIITFIVTLPFVSYRWYLAVKSSKMATDAYQKMGRLSEYMLDREKLTKNQPAQELAEVPATKPIGKSRFTSFNLVLLMVLFVVVPVESACSSGMSIPATYEECTRQDNIEVCGLVTSLVASIPYPGSSLCITFTDNSLPVANIEVTYESAIDTVDTSVMYYTSNWTICPQSNKNCYGNGCSGAKCDKFANGEDFTARISDSCVRNHPGGQNCYRSCGCVSCGCGSCSSSCVYHAYGVVPEGEQFVVRRLENRIRTPHVKLNVSDTMGVIELGTVSMVNGIAVIGGVKLEVIGSLVGSNSDFGTYKIVHNLDNVNETWLSDAASTGTPIRLGVGDIQAATQAKLTTQSRTAFIHDRAAITYSEGRDQANYQWSSSGLINRVNGKLLPNIIGADMWSYDHPVGKLRANITNPGALLVTLTISGELEIRKFVSLVCPKFVVDRADGCYSCPTGAEVTITARSTCQDGFALVSTDAVEISILTTSVQLTGLDVVYVIQITTSEQMNDFSLTLSNGAASETHRVQFTASEYIPYLNDTVTGSSGTQDKKDTSIGGFGSFFSKGIGNRLWNVFHGFGNALEIFLTVLILFAVAYLVFMAAFKFMAWAKPSSWAGKLGNKTSKTD